MNSKSSSRGIRRWLFLVLMWVIAPLVILTVLFIGVRTNREMRREISTPVIVKHLLEGSTEIEREYPANRSSSSREGQLDGDPSNGFQHGKRKPFEPLFPESSDSREGDSTRQRLNEAFRAVEMGLLDYESNKEALSFREADELLKSIRNGPLSEYWGLIGGLDYPYQSRNSKKGKRGQADAEKVWSHFWDLTDRAHYAIIENAVLHEMWIDAAHYTPKKEWDERVYYLQREGGPKGTLYIA